MNTTDNFVISKSLLSEIPDYNSETMKSFLDIYNKAKVELFIEKDEQYGGSWQKEGALSGFFNLKRKIDRVISQFKNGKLYQFSEDSTGETSVDTFMDLENYSAMNVGYLFLKCKTQAAFDVFCKKVPGLSDAFGYVEGIGVRPKLLRELHPIHPRDRSCLRCGERDFECVCTKSNI